MRGALVLAGLALLAAPAPAPATVPGHNGRLAWQVYGQPASMVKTATPEGLDVQELGSGTAPAWSPDGRRVALTTVTESGDGPRYELRVRSADGDSDRPLLAGDALAGLHASWSPDGESIVFTGIADRGRGDADLYVVDVRGIDDRAWFGSVRRLTDAPGQEMLPDWSPDGAWIAFTRAGELRLVPSGGGGGERALAPGYRAERPSWRPDAGEIAFAGTAPGESTSRSGDLFAVAPAPDATPRRLTFDEVPDMHPSWSPDGTAIAFSTIEDRAARSDIAILDLATLGRTRVITTADVETMPAWQPATAPTVGPPPPGGEADPPPYPGPPPPAGRHEGLIVFSREHGGDAELFTINPGGGDLRQLTRNDVADRQPAWSPAVAGQPSRVAWTQFRGDGPHVMTMRADGSGARDLGPGQMPAWSPDGRRIAFATAPQPARAPEIWSMTEAGGDRRRISPAAPASSFYVEPGWSPDGTRILASRYDYVQHRFDLCSFAAYVGVADTSCDHGWGPRRTPAWVAPSARGPLGELLFAAAMPFGPRAFTEVTPAIWTAPASGADPVALVPGLRLHHPSASPAGSAFVAEIATGGGAGLMLVRTTSEPRPVQGPASMSDGGTAIETTRTSLPRPAGSADRDPDWQARRRPLPPRARGRFVGRARVDARAAGGRLVLRNRNRFWITAEVHTRGRARAARRLARLRLGPATGSRATRAARRIRVGRGLRIVLVDPRGGQRTLRVSSTRS